jgi:hypothetical protein
LEFAASFGRLAANHLWQFTAFTAVAVLLALALRANHAPIGWRAAVERMVRKSTLGTPRRSA